MSDPKSSGNLSKGDVISFIALLLMGVLVFFGMNFMTLGDRIPSLVVAIITVVLMTVFVFLAAFAKAQDTHQATWKKVMYAMLGLYVLSLIPCYIFTAKFFDVQFDKENIMDQVQADTDALDALFTDYSRKCASRTNTYDITLKSLLTTYEGRARIAKMLDISTSSVSEKTVENADSTFSNTLKGPEYKALESEKNSLVRNSESNFKNWNIMFIPQYAYELGSAKKKYAAELERIYNSTHNSLEKYVPELKISSDEDDSFIITAFKSTDRFSPMGLIAVLFLGALGLVKYLLGPSSRVVPMKLGNASDIEKNGGIII